MARVAFGSTVLLSALAISASLVVADTQKKSDPEGDTRGSMPGKPFDIKSAQVTHTRGKVAHRIESWGPASASAAYLNIYANGETYTANYQNGKALIFTPAGRKVGEARFKRHSKTSFSLILGMGFAQNPARYKWDWVVYGETSTFDKVPNKGRVTHRLR